MERTAGNLLRLVLIVVVSLLVLFAGALLLVSWAFYGTLDPNAQHSLLKESAGVLTFFLIGILVLVKLAKGIRRVPPSPRIDAYLPDTHAEATPQTVRPVIAGILVQMGLSLVNGVFQLSKYQGQGLLPDNWKFILIASFVSYQLPYVLLAIGLAKKPDRKVFALALTIPCISIVHSLLHILTFQSAYRVHPETFPVLFLFLGMDAVIFWLALRANRQYGYEHPPSSLAAAIFALLVYFWITPPMNLWFYALREG